MTVRSSRRAARPGRRGHGTARRAHRQRDLHRARPKPARSKPRVDERTLRAPQARRCRGRRAWAATTPAPAAAARNTSSATASWPESIRNNPLSGCAASPFTRLRREGDGTSAAGRPLRGVCWHSPRHFHGLLPVCCIFQGRRPMPVNLSAPDRCRPAPHRRRAHRRGRSRHPQGQPQGPDRVPARRRRRGGGVFTQNRFCAAPVQVCREHLAASYGIRAMVINTGNANAGTGDDGLRARARHLRSRWRAQLGMAPEQVLPFSTGVIMEPLPVERIEAGLPAAIADAQPDHWARAAEGIMTTDTVPKAFSAAGADRRRDGHGHRHQQGRRHDPPEHGDHARLHGHRRLHRPGADAAAGARAGRRVVQPHHHRRRHLDQRFVRRHRDAAGGPRPDHLAGTAPTARP